MRDKSVVLVGVDGSKPARNALRWAARAAAARDHQLHVVCAYSVPRFGATSVDAAYLDVGTSALEEGAQAVVDTAVEDAKEIHQDVRGALELGDAAGALVERSKDADLVVVGTRGKGGFAERLLGTVSTAVPVHAHCPAVVVPASWDGEHADGTVKRIVVGVDGSQSSKVALEHAIDWALDTGAELRVFTSMPLAAGTSLFAWAPGQADHSALLGELDEELGRLIDAELAGREAPEGLEIRRHALDGTASALLVDFSKDADLVVVGSRGRGGFKGLLLGSTSQAVLHHSHCPVMVVPMRCRKDRAEADGGADA